MVPAVMAIDVTPETERQLIQKYLGTPYKHQGRDLAGLDCWTFLQAFYADLGFHLWDVNFDYDKDWSDKGCNYFIENYHREWRKVSAPGLYDVVLFKNKKGVARHCGIVLSQNRFIHCRKIGVVIDSLDNLQWKKNVEGFYRLKAIEGASCT